MIRAVPVMRMAHNFVTFAPSSDTISVGGQNGGEQDIVVDDFFHQPCQQAKTSPHKSGPVYARAPDRGRAQEGTT